MASSGKVNIRGLEIGGGAPVRVESMLKSRIEDTEKCLEEIGGLRKAGCELVRVAFPDDSCGPNLSKIIERSEIPIMADIHFNHKFALTALDCGAASIRINPGNMSGRAGLESVLSAAESNGAVIRIGANGGSIGASRIAACGGDRALALVNAAAEQIELLTRSGFEDIIISAKSSSVTETVRANHMLSGRYDFPMHIGITEAGAGMSGAVKSAAGLAILLAQGIGDTIRVSLTGESVQEAEAGFTLLRSLNMRRRGVDIISCPCCGRRRVDVSDLLAKVKGILPEGLPDGFTIAVMGCEVNGPQEAAAADIGIAGTPKGFVLFRRGKAVASGGTEDMETSLAIHLKQSLDEFA
ncbi:MAG: flavodoxin-dependent (E)-4-hydroxy-3-methylbut-2-enyl-diphosphate synthase [Synergistaceae bacterium]|jgi:(E)-4-hydroxy-3-methylbut-2-enyl-diphosphate synthase|nr:flavodoxin-dependent (E)-4-hydroxy-3-methylbut-2-enyl-diphosphate synthase [Synergistaceae bacterium]